MDALPASDTTRWLSLGDACRLLDVSQATLRQWADQALMGVIESYQERMPQPEPAGVAR